MSELEIYQRQGLGRRLGFGQKSALLIIDFTNGFNDPAVFGGGNISDAISRTQVVLDAARRQRIPIAYTREIYADDASNAGVFTMKSPRLKELTRANPLSQIVPELAPRAGEHVIDKTEASAFFGTGLAAWLAFRRVDTIIVTGCTTSGCVRSTVVDACAHNFRPIVPRDCVRDRALAPHEANLFDMDQKYADVMASNEVIAEIGRVAAP